MNALEQLQHDFEALQLENTNLKESAVSRALALEDLTWKSLLDYAQNDDGLTLGAIHTLSDKLRELAATNPWHIRGAQLRHSYVFGRGMMYTNIKPAAQKIIDDPHNKENLFSVDGYEQANLALFTDGQFIVRYSKRTRRFNTVPMKEITATITDPEDDSDIWGIRREWSAGGQQYQQWYPTARFESRGQRLTVPLNERLNTDSVVFIKRSKKQAGWTWGVPDSLGAMLWTLAYSAYLQNNSRLVEALSKFAWSITQKTSTGVANTAAQIVQPGVGGTAVSGDGAALASVGVPSAQVNMNNGQPLIAAVAASLGVSVIALLGSPGATGGSYGAATTLDSPTIHGFESIQDSWKTWYEEIFRYLASKDASIDFPSIDPDPTYRIITSVATMLELGALWPDEARQSALDLLDITPLHAGANPNPPGKGVVSAQGVSGGVPGGQGQNVTDHSGE